MHTLESHRFDDTLQISFIRLHNINILRTDHHIHRLILREALIHTDKLKIVKSHQEILDHDTFDNIRLTDEACHKAVLRFIVNVNRGTDLLNSSLIHNNYCIRHGERLLLVMGNKHESDTHFLLDLLQLRLHLLTQSGIQSA